MEDIFEIIDVKSKNKTKYFKKKEIIQSQGSTVKSAYLVKKGLVRSFFIDEKGKEHIYMFASEGWIIADLESQEFNRPSELSIDCIEDSEIIILSINYFKKENISIEKLKKHSVLMARRIAVLQRRVIMLMSYSAKQRYLRFIDTYPSLPNRIPQKMIASYLGITPEALSKIRNQKKVET
jgi:CRP-like cAMP-binding protein